MKILGIDYGTKRVGIAVSDDTGSIAFPKAVLKNSHTLLSEIKATIESNNIAEIVVGKSLDTKGEENVLMEYIRQFVDLLQKDIKLPVHLEPEQFTSQEAHKGKRGGEVSEHMIDAAAASLILQRYLDKKNKQKGDVV